MLVCPSCRAENLEDAGVCRHCGNSLVAVSSPMRRLDRSEEVEPQVELPPARATSVWPLAITALVVGLGLLGWGLFSAVQPNPCQGKYSSVLFSYCTDVPEGWTAAPRFEPGGNLDSYLLLQAGATDPAATDQAATDQAATGPAATDQAATGPAATDQAATGPAAADQAVTGPGGAETTVEVTELIDPTVATQQYVQQFRTSQEADGLNLGKIEGVMLDGEQAIGWDFSVQQGQPVSTLHVRDVILVRGDGAWQIRFVSTPEAYDVARIGFEEMLAAWRWK